MKTFGLILVAVGVGVLAFTLFLFFRDKDKVVSPLPDEKGIKIIYVTPSE